MRLRFYSPGAFRARPGVTNWDSNLPSGFSGSRSRYPENPDSTENPEVRLLSPVVGRGRSVTR